MGEIRRDSEALAGLWSGEFGGAAHAGAERPGGAAEPDRLSPGRHRIGSTSDSPSGGDGWGIDGTR